MRKSLLMVVALAAAVGGFAVSAHAAAPQTWADFKNALEAAQDGDTVYVENDLAWDSPLTNVNKRVTIRSRGESRFALTRGNTSNARFLTQTYGRCAAADVTFEQVIVDGAKQPGSVQGEPILMEQGRVTLGAGCTFRNFSPRYAGLTVDLDGVLTMEEGSEITGFESWTNASLYGSVVRVGNGHPTAAHPTTGRFVMNGGTIHGNVDNCTTNDLTYGGIVYVYTGTMDFYGGLITSNRSTCTCGGLMNFVGEVHVKGRGSVIDNVGGIANDVATAKALSIFVDDFYTGRMTFYQSGMDKLKLWDAVMGWSVNTTDFPEWADYGTGSNQALNVSCQGKPNLVVAPYNRSYVQHYWTERIAELDDGRTFCVNAASLTDENKRSVFVKALDAVTNGGTVALAHDVTLTKSTPLLGDRSYTLTSYGGVRRTISRAEINENTSTMLTLGTASSVRIENLVLDGRADLDTGHVCPASLVHLSVTGARLTLGPGGVIRNAWTMNATPSAVLASAVGSGFTMETGSLIEDCGSWSASSYGSVIRVGNSGAYRGDATAAFFDMKGGSITRCESRATNAGQGYGGVVYLYDGLFRMSGGAITNNVDGNYGCAGVFAYVGNAYISGTARIADNTGAYPGLRLRAVGTGVTVEGDFRGHVELASGDQEAGDTAGVTVAAGADATPFSGAWNLEPSRTTSAVPLVGALEEGVVNWRAAVGGVDGVLAATEADLRTIWSQQGALHPSADGSGARVLSGAAKAMDWALDVVFDPLAWRTSPALPYTLVRSDEGALTGDMSFTFPVCRGGSFAANRAVSGDRWLMTFDKNGLILFVR